MKSFKLSRFKLWRVAAARGSVALGSITNKDISASVLLSCWSLKSFHWETTALKIQACFFIYFLFIIILCVCLRLSWDLFLFFFSRWLKAELCLPCFTAPIQSKIAWGIGNNYLNLPPLVMLDHRRGLSRSVLQTQPENETMFSHVTVTCLPKVCCSVSADSKDSNHYISCTQVITSSCNHQNQTLASVHAQMHTHTRSEVQTQLNPQ